MSELRVGTDAVRDAGARARALMEEFSEALSETDRVSAHLIGTWTGPASGSFLAGWTEWTRGASEVQAALAGIARLLGESADQYESTESTVTQVSKSSSVTVGGAA